MEKKKGKKSKYQIFRSVVQWLSLTCFCVAVAVILVESAIPGEESGQQSDSVADVVQGGIDADYDAKNLKELKSFAVTPEKTEAHVGDILKYQIAYDPVEASFKGLNWTISEPEKVKIDYVNQTIECLKEGAVDFTIVSKRNEELQYQFSLDIQPIDLEKIVLPYSSLTLVINDTLELNPVLYPANATYTDMEYEVENENIAYVDEYGVLTAKAPGETTLKISSVEYPDIYATAEIIVQEAGKKPIEQIQLAPVNLYPFQKNVKLVGSYLPLDSAFNPSNLSFNCDDENLKLSKVTVNEAKNTFECVLSYDKDVVNVTSLDVAATYRLDENESLETTTAVTVHPRAAIGESDLDMESLKDTYYGEMYSLTYYGGKGKTANNLTIDLPFNADIEAHPERYITSDYDFEVPSSLKVISSSFDSITVTPTALDSDFAGTIVYHWGDSSVDLPFSYRTIEDGANIIGISFDDLYTDDENEANILCVNQSYPTLFEHQILASEGKAVNAFSDSGLTYTVLDGEENIRFIKDESGEVTGVKTLKEGKVTIQATSKFETDIGYATPTQTAFTLNIVSNPNASKLSCQGNDYDATKTLVLTKNSRNTLEYLTYASPSLKTEFPTAREDIPFDVSIADPTIVSYSPESATLMALKAGETTISFTPKDEAYSNLALTLNIKVDHVEVAYIKLRSKVLSYPEGNVPGDDFNSVAIGTKFQLTGVVNDDATIKEVGYRSTDPEVISVNNKTGECLAKKIGTASIVCYSLDDPAKSNARNITVLDSATRFSLNVESFNPMEYSIVTDDEEYGEYTYLKLRYGNNYNFQWDFDDYATSSDFDYELVSPLGEQQTDDVLYVDSKGNISLLNTGTCWVKVTYGKDTLNPQVQYYKVETVRDTSMSFGELAAMLRKLLGHFLLFTATAMLGMHFIALAYPDLKKRSIGAAIALVIGFAFAALSEFIQMFTPGRGPSWRDVGIDFGGFTLGVVIFMIAFLIDYGVRKYKAKKKSEKEKKD